MRLESASKFITTIALLSRHCVVEVEVDMAEEVGAGMQATITPGEGAALLKWLLATASTLSRCLCHITEHLPCLLADMHRTVLRLALRGVTCPTLRTWAMAGLRHTGSRSNSRRGRKRAFHLRQRDMMQPMRPRDTTTMPSPLDMRARQPCRCGRSSNTLTIPPAKWRLALKWQQAMGYSMHRSRSIYSISVNRSPVRQGYGVYGGAVPGQANAAAAGYADASANAAGAAAAAAGAGGGGYGAGAYRGQGAAQGRVDRSYRPY